MTKTNPNNIISVSLLISLTQSLKVMLRMDGDRLIISKFCQNANGVEFHEWSKSSNECCINISILYFEYNMKPPAHSDLPINGDTIIGNDVWISQNATIPPGAHIGDGSIIGANCVVCSNVESQSLLEAQQRYLENNFVMIL